MPFTPLLHFCKETALAFTTGFGVKCQSEQDAKLRAKHTVICGVFFHSFTSRESTGPSSTATVEVSILRLFWTFSILRAYDQPLIPEDAKFAGNIYLAITIIS